MNESKIPGIILYIKVPKIGFVKTRLVSDDLINETQAYEIQKAMIKDTLQTLSSLDKRFQPIISYYPEDRLDELKNILQSFTDSISDSFIKSIHFISQEGETNGTHFASTFNKAFQLQDISSCIIIGGDTPHLPKRILKDAIDWLTTQETSAVLGPSQLGGFYIFGLNSQTNDLDSIFSKNNEFANLLEISSKYNLKIKLLPFIFDIDIADDVSSLFQLSQALERNKNNIIEKNDIHFPSNTINYLEKHIFSNNYF